MTGVRRAAHEMAGRDCERRLGDGLLDLLSAAKDNACQKRTTEEFFDVVDGNDAVIGRATAEVHAHGLLHRAVHAGVQPNRALFLQKRSRNKDTAQVCGFIPLRHVDAGETMRMRRRELGEEIGLEITHPPSVVGRCL